jgi:hypothetical protein
VRRWYRAAAKGAALLAGGAGLGIMAAACSSESEKAPGVLMLALSTDMEVPKDFDQVLVQVQSGAGKEAHCKLLAWSGSDAEPASSGASECTGGIDQKELKLPATVGLASQKTGAATVTVTAYRGGETVFCRSFKATGLPTAGDGTVPMKRVDISWLETKEAGADVSCTKAAEVVVSDLPKYSDEAVLGGAEGKCFDTLGAVQSAKALEVDLSQECTVADVAQGSSLLWVKPAGSMGICGRAACFVPVDAATVDGWRPKPTDTGLEFPSGVCKLLQSGRIRAVLAVAKGDAKTESIPTCGAWSSVTSRPGTVEDPLPLAGELWAYWNIDEGKGSKWLDASYQGRDLASGAQYVDTRVGGRGKAARFTGSESAELPDATPFERQAFTLSAWVSFNVDDKTDDFAACGESPWPVISTRSGECAGYELGIQCATDSDGSKSPSAVFTYGCDEQGQRLELVAALPKNSGKWTAGDWYHLAATYDGGRAALFLDGSKANSNGDDSVHASKLTFAGQSLYVGRDPDSAAEGFHGYLDDILVFGRALDDEAMRELYETSVTVQGPSGMRWGTWDAIGSVASLAEDSEEQDLGVRVDEDVECSSGGAVAHLSQTQLEQLVYGADTAVLDADITEGEWFEFSMSGLHGRPQCTWYGVGGTQMDHGYEFDLKRPNWCANSDGCAIDPSSMRTATISTHWKSQESLTLSIRSLRFWPSSGPWFWNGMNRPSPDGVNLCWRPVTYEPDPVASALWSRGTWDHPEWPVTLSGEKQSTAEAAAFVLGHPLNLTGCTDIEITWGEGSSSGPLELTIENADGVTCSEPVTGKSPNPQTVPIPSSGCYDCAGSRPDSTEVTPAVTRIALRKQWDISFDSAGLNVEDIALLPRGCAGAPE